MSAEGLFKEMRDLVTSFLNDMQIIYREHGARRIIDSTQYLIKKPITITYS